MVKRMIDSSGRAVTVSKQGAQAQDQDQPWRGQDKYPPAQVTGNGVYVSANSLGHLVQNKEGLKRAQQVLLFPADDDQGQLLEDFDQVLDGTTSWRISQVEVLQPGEVRMLYVFGLTR